MFKKSGLVLGVLWLLASSAVAYSAELTKQEMIQEIINNSDVKAQMDSFKKAVAQQMQAQMAASGKTFTPEQTQRLTEIIFSGMDEIIEETLPAAVRFYDENFSEEEIGEIYAYTTSATGKKLIALTPEFTTQLMQDMTPKLMARMPAMQQELLEFLEETSN